MSVEFKLKELGVEIPDVAKPAASYVPYLKNDGILHISGQLPFENGELKKKGIVGRDVDLETAKQAARACAINILACAKAACGGNLESLEQVLQLTVLVASTPEFTEQHLVANGASNFLVEVLGNDVGSHTRAAFGIASIPLNACVEIAATIKIRS